MTKTFTEVDAICIDRFIYSQFILYKTLRTITKPLTTNINPPIINVFIDLYSMITPLYSFYKFENPIALTSALINSGIHYRNYFKKFNVYTNIFLIYSPNMSSNNLKYCPSYNLANINKMFSNYETKQIVDQNLSLLSTIIPYVPDIYLRLGTVEPSIMILDCIRTFESRGFVTKNLVISSSPISFQIPVINPNTVVYTKRRNGDVLVTDSINPLIQALSYTKNQVIDNLNLPPSYLSAFYSLCGLNRLNVNSLVYYSTAIDILRYMKDNSIIMEPDTLCEAYIIHYQSKKKKIDKINDIVSQIHNRFRCFDFRHQLMMYDNLAESKETSYLTQLQNWDELLHINKLYFKDNPILLDKL